MLLGSLLERRRLAPAASPRRLGVAAVVVALIVGGGVSWPRAMTGGDSLVVEASRHVRLEEYGAAGSHVAGYRHGERLVLRFTVHNRGWLPITLHDVDAFPMALGMLRPVDVRVDGRSLPVRLGPGGGAEVTATGVFDNCEYFTERAINTYDHAAVTWRALGVSRAADIGYGDHLLVRSPTIVDCPGRVLDRSAKQRSRDATITGRG
jgi:hypothetical protein